MNILSLYTSLPSTVAIYQDGKIVAATHEERFTRKKNDERFPCKSIQYCLQEAGLRPNDLDAVAIAGFLAFHLTIPSRKKANGASKIICGNSMKDGYRLLVVREKVAFHH